MDLADEKAGMRDRLKAVLRGISPEDRTKWSQIVADKVTKLAEFSAARTVMVFLPMRTEVDTSSIAQACWAMGKRVLAPRLTDNNRRMVAVELGSLADGLVTSPLGFREPRGPDSVAISEVEFLLVPGLGFDRQGNRLGRGGGHYDQLLADSDFSGVACALSFEQQVCAEIPVGPLDQTVDLLVTECEVYRFSRRG